ncbi:MAG: hypothetical protein GY853_16610 [PVC group bacterium]|nr:hypothetical protein [PVC group bacterium]
MKKCNGWTNYPTWSVNLWLVNEASSYFHLMEKAKEFVNNPEYIQGIELKPEVRLADYIKEIIESDNPLNKETNVYSDLLQYVIEHVDYREIAINMIGSLIHEVK